MRIPQRRVRWVWTIALLVGPLWVSPAAADSFTARWNVAPTDTAPDPPPPSPLYDCPFWGGGGLICRWLWDQGLEISSQTVLPMYGDFNPFYDAFGTNPPLESDIASDPGVLGIVAHCRPGLDPCLATFTPRNIVVGLFDRSDRAGVFFRSSKGGLVTGNGSVNFAGAEWTNITSMDIGIFLPDACADPEEELDCSPGEELGLDVLRLAFDATPVPEPVTMLLVGTGLLAALRRYRRP